jgi:hypothetical protein
VLLLSSIRSIGRHVEAGHIPAVTPEQQEAMKVLEETANSIALHMILDVGDVRIRDSGRGRGMMRMMIHRADSSAVSTLQ